MQLGRPRPATRPFRTPVSPAPRAKGAAYTKSSPYDLVPCLRGNGDQQSKTWGARDFRRAISGLGRFHPATTRPKCVRSHQHPRGTPPSSLGALKRHILGPSKEGLTTPKATAGVPGHTVKPRCAHNFATHCLWRVFDLGCYSIIGGFRLWPRWLREPGVAQLCTGPQAKTCPASRRGRLEGWGVDLRGGRLVATLDPTSLRSPLVATGRGRRHDVWWIWGASGWQSEEPCHVHGLQVEAWSHAKQCWDGGQGDRRADHACCMGHNLAWAPRHTMGADAKWTGGQALPLPWGRGQGALSIGCEVCLFTSPPQLNAHARAHLHPACF